MNSINNKSIIKTLEIYLSQYKDIFYKRSFENFKVIIIALLYIQEGRSINFIYDKSKTKLEVAADMIIDVALALSEYEVIVTCDSWYTKAPFISSIKKFENINIIGALRSDTAMFDLNIDKTHKRGRTRKRGQFTMGSL